MYRQVKVQTSCNYEASSFTCCTVFGNIHRKVHCATHEHFRLLRVQCLDVGCMANFVGLLLCANLSRSSKSHPNSGYSPRPAKWNFTVKLVAIQKDSVYCYVAFCCNDDLLFSVGLGVNL